MFYCYREALRFSMIKIYVFAIVLFLSFNIYAQTPKKSEEKRKTTVDASESKESPADSVDEVEKISEDSTVDDSDSEKLPVGDVDAILEAFPEKRTAVKVPNITDVIRESPLKIDGKLDEAAWEKAALFSDFIQTSPGDNIAPSKKTEAYVMYDAKNLYIAFRCWDERENIRSTITKRDSVFREDNVRVWLDTYDDQRRAYVLGWNPIGIQADGIFLEEQGKIDFSLDIVMESKGMIHDWGWLVEVKIPFKSLRYKAGEGEMWGFNAARNIDRLNDELDSWMPLDRNINGLLIQHGKIIGLDGIKAERTLEVIPSMTISQTGKKVPASENPSGKFVNEAVRQEYGVNFKYTITPNITFDAAINPDFAEIEADAPVITANRRFPIFFEERRPFFLEGADIFRSPLRVFHSRKIVDPDFALKLTGKVASNSFGFLAASDNAPGNFDEESLTNPSIRPFIDEILDKNALFTVIRLKRDIGENNNIGFFGTTRIFPERRNFLGGFDGRFKVSSKYDLTFQLVGSHSRRCIFDPAFDDIENPVQAQRNGEICGGAIVNGVQKLGNVHSRYRTGNGVAYNLEFVGNTDTSALFFNVRGTSRYYRADAGFNRRTNTNDLIAGFRKSTESKPKAKIIRINWTNNFMLAYDWQGRLQKTGYKTNVNFSFPRNTFVNFWTGVDREVLYEEEFGLMRLANRTGAFFGPSKREETQPFAGMFFRMQPSEKFSVRARTLFIWNSFDLDFGSGRRFPRVSPAYLSNPNASLDPGPGRRVNFDATINVVPADSLRISFDFRKNRLVRNETNRTAFDANIFTLRSTYQFNRFIFARARGDYNTLRSNVNSQFLFGWNPNPGTAFYAGYNDNFNYNGFNQHTGDFEPGFKRTDRTFFIRVSYLFRKSF